LSVPLNRTVPFASSRRASSTTCFAAALLIAIAFALSASAEAGNPALATAPALGGARTPPQVDYLPPVPLIDQNGKSILLNSLKGKPVLVGFIHTSCKGVCEMMTAKMRQVAEGLGRQFNSSVTMVSISTDPDDDSPAQLLKYAKAQNVDAEGYLFLTGTQQQIDRLLRLYHVPEEGPDETTVHVLDFFLVAPDGSSMRKYNGMAVSAEALASDIRNADPRH
jgi:cytochrome oxidase Cu insertion factor (SCO1/SenC/PrrC family)